MAATAGHDTPFLRPEAPDVDKGLFMKAVHTDTISIRRHFIPCPAARAIARRRGWESGAFDPGSGLEYLGAPRRLNVEPLLNVTLGGQHAQHSYHRHPDLDRRRRARRAARGATHEHEGLGGRLSRD